MEPEPLLEKDASSTEDSNRRIDPFEFAFGLCMHKKRDACPRCH
jgi:hypothetical protein